MKRVSILIAALLIATGCGNDDTGPAANDNLAQFTAALLSSNETLPIGGGETTAAGTARIDFNLTKDGAGAITAATVDFRVDLTGFPAGSAITLAHIHTGAAGVAGGVLVNTGLAGGEVTLVSGAGSFTKLGVTSSNIAANAQAIINNPAGYYFNVHSSANPSGVVRGQLVRR